MLTTLLAFLVVIFTTLLTFLVVICILIAVHEWGHYRMSSETFTYFDNTSNNSFCKVGR